MLLHRAPAVAWWAHHAEKEATLVLLPRFRFREKEIADPVCGTLDRRRMPRRPRTPSCQPLFYSLRGPGQESLSLPRSVCATAGSAPVGAVAGLRKDSLLGLPWG